MMKGREKIKDKKRGYRNIRISRNLKTRKKGLIPNLIP
jgi:hypothetical protein